MKAIWEVTFNFRESNRRERQSDTRRIIATADTKGFKKVAQWAAEHEGDDEFVAGIKLIVTEHL